MPWWVLIPIVAILVGAFTEWLSFKEKQAKLGTSTSELEKTVAVQQQALEAAQRRIENLEAIVTSQVWDVLHDEALRGLERLSLRHDGFLQLARRSAYFGLFLFEFKPFRERADQDGDNRYQDPPCHSVQPFIDETV